MGKKRDKLRDAKPVSRLNHLITQFCIRPLVFQIFRPKPLNTEIIPLRGPAILVANHVNFFDPIWIYVVLDRTLHFVAT